jgi:transcriptional regulator with GAF, ATPase, and Fis domain
MIDALLTSEVAGIALFDEQEACVRANAAMSRLAGEPPLNMVGRTLQRLLGKRVEELAVIRTVLRTRSPVYDRTIEGPGLQLRVDYLPVAAPGGDADGVVIVAVDLSAQRRAESAVEEQLANARLISEVSAGFIDLDPAQIDGAIAKAVRLIGECLDIDGTHIGSFSEDRSTLRLTHQWVREGYASTIDQFQAFPVSALPWTSARVLAGQSAVVHALDELPAQAQAERLVYDALGAKAVVVMPLGVGGVVDGIISFSHARAPRQWTPDVLSSLRLTAEIIAGALDRKRADALLRERLDFEEALSVLATRFISTSAEGIDAAIEEALSSIGRVLGYERCSLVASAQARALGATLAEAGAGRVTVLDAVALVPMSVENQLLGWIGFYGPRRPLAAAMLARLTLVGDMIAGVIARKRSEEARRLAYAGLERAKNRAEGERDYLREEACTTRSIVGSSAPLQRLLEVIDVVAVTAATVLLRGESGVGKEVFARAIHERSARSEGPLVKVNCASVPKDLFESEFFGHVRGAFTGALKDRAGRFELADGGTLFLDEIGDIPIDLQAKLLRVLQESEFERVGDDRTRRVDVRVIAATNRNLDADVAAGHFRQDLYYRLSVFPIEVPPLRARREDVPLLAEHFLQRSATRLNRHGLELSEEQRRLILAYDWPGNVRELQHVIERAVILSAEPPLQLERALQVAVQPTAAAPTPLRPAPGTPAILREEELRQLERVSIATALERTGGRIAGPGGAAELLGVRHSTLRDRIKALGIRRSA